MHLYKAAFARVRVEKQDGPIALEISLRRSPGPNLELLFEPTSSDVFGMLRIATDQWDSSLGSHLKAELERQGFVRIVSSPSENLPQSAKQYSAFLGVDEPTEVRLVSPSLPGDPAELAQLAETITQIMFERHVNFEPEIMVLIPEHLRSQNRMKKAWPLFPKGHQATDTEMIVGFDETLAPTDSGGGGRRGEAGEVADEVDRPWTIAIPDDPARRGAPGAYAAAVVEQDPPRSAYALLAADDVVVAQVPFEVTVGISPTPMLGVQGDAALQRPAWSVGPYDLTIQVIADGFSIQPGESWRHDLPVNKGVPYPNVTLHLTPDSQTGLIVPRAIQAIYSIGGQTIGHAFRPVSVVRTPDLLDQTPAPAPPSVTITVVPGERPPDLTVRITFAGAKTDGRLAWTFDSRLAVAVPEKALFCDPGANREEFARQLINDVNRDEGKHGIYDTLKGKGVYVAKDVPPEFWGIVRAVAEKTTPDLPTILLLSEEPYIPWELAIMPVPLLNVDAAPFLGAQAIVGRWVLSAPPPPAPLPPAELRVTTAAVISGDYSQVQNARALPEAQAEASEVAALFASEQIPADYSEVLACIKGRPLVQLLHFAVHGKYDQTGFQDGLLLIEDGKLRTLSATVVTGVDLGGATPFVFLNACQVGSSNDVLGSYAGLAAAFLNAGASAVVAPLWSVDDNIAKEIALRFYDAVSKGDSPAAFLRAQRAKVTDSPDRISGTHLAYLFFGDPSMKLSLAKKAP